MALIIQRAVVTRDGAPASLEASEGRVVVNLKVGVGLG